MGIIGLHISTRIQITVSKVKLGQTRSKTDPGQN